MAEHHAVTTVVTVTLHAMEEEAVTVEVPQISISGGRRTVCTINVNYLKSWQGQLRILKLLFGIVCIVISKSVQGLKVFPRDPSAFVQSTFILFVVDLIWFLLYLLTLNKLFPKCHRYLLYAVGCIIVICAAKVYSLTIAYSLMAGVYASIYSAATWLVLHYHAVNKRFRTQLKCVMLKYHAANAFLCCTAILVVITNGGTFADAYVAFGLLQFVSFCLDVQLFFSWLSGGPELVSLSAYLQCDAPNSSCCDWYTPSSFCRVKVLITPKPI